MELLMLLPLAVRLGRDISVHLNFWIWQTPPITKLRFEILLSRNNFWVWQMTTHYQTQSCKMKKGIFFNAICVVVQVGVCLWFACATGALSCLPFKLWKTLESSCLLFQWHHQVCCLQFYVTIQISISTHCLQWRSTSMSCSLQKFLTKGFESS
jgi:hypothetical protein